MALVRRLFLRLEFVQRRPDGRRALSLSAAEHVLDAAAPHHPVFTRADPGVRPDRSEEHTSELQSHSDLVCRLLLEKKKLKLKLSLSVVEDRSTPASPTATTDTALSA